MYENQNEKNIDPLNIQVKNVWIIKIKPIERGCFNCINIILIIIIVNIINIIKISRSSLFKILILEINEKEFLFSWSFKRGILNFDLQDQYFC